MSGSRCRRLKSSVTPTSCSATRLGHVGPVPASVFETAARKGAAATRRENDLRLDSWLFSRNVVLARSGRCLSDYVPTNHDCYDSGVRML
jgi:hypothetical protein